MQYRFRSLFLILSFVALLSPELGFAAKKKAPKAKKPAGSIEVKTDDLFEVILNGERIQCRRGDQNQAGHVVQKKGKLFFIPEAKSSKTKMNKIKSRMKKAKNKKAKQKLKKQLIAVRTARDEKNGACINATQLPPETVPLPAECTDLSRYDGPWGVDQVKDLFFKAAWAANTMEQAEGAANGMDHTVDNMLLRRNGMVPTNELGTTMYDWLDAQLGNLSGQDPQEPGDISTDGLRYSRIENYMNNPNKFYTYLTELLHQQVAASYRVLGGSGRHLFLDYWSLLENLALSGDHSSFVYNMGQDALYMLVWLNLRSSSVQDGDEPNEDGLRELLQLTSMMGQFNKGDPNRGFNYSNEDINKLSYPMVYGGDVRYDNLTGRDGKVLIPDRAYRGPPVEVGLPGAVEGQTWMPHRTVANYAEIVDMIRNHPGTANGVANFLIENYLYRNPPAYFVDALGKIIRDDGLNFQRRALPMLLKSKAIHSSCARNAIVKSPVQFYVGFVQATGFPIDADSLDEIIGRDQLIGNPVSVFGYDYSSGITARRLQSLENGIVNIIRRNYDPFGWYYFSLFPHFGASASEVIDHICQDRLGVNLSQYPTLKTQLLDYADKRLNNQGGFDRRLFDSYYEMTTDQNGNTVIVNRSSAEPKVHGFSQVCAMTTNFLTK